VQSNRAPAHRPTLEEVAAHAGVSRATVSRVVNGVSSVDPELADLVRRSVAALGYVPNQAARTLMTRRTDAVALVAAEPDTRVFGDPFFSGVVRGISQELTRANMQLVVVMAHDLTDLARIESYLLGRHVDGVLLISEHGHHRLASTLFRAGIPLVVGGRPVDTDISVPYVDNDNRRGGQIAGDHLVRLGRKRIATIAGPADMSAGADRLHGFIEALGPAYQPELVDYGDFTTDSGAAAMTRLLERAPDLDGLFVASDLMALGALSVLRRANRLIPADVAVVGFDDIDLAAVSVPGLTTIRQRTVDQGRAMVHLLFSLIGRDGGADGEDAAPAYGIGPVILPVELVRRESA
jgi:DNA-binding LacI/PurR family transcriptional regulator